MRGRKIFALWPLTLLKCSAILILLLAPTIVQCANSFEDRVLRAKELEKTPAGKAYQSRMWPKVQPFVAELMQKCVPNDESADLRSFLFIATLSPDGELTQLEVQPETDVSKCFLRGMEHAPFPEPPTALAEGGMPIVLNMRLHVQ